MSKKIISTPFENSAIAQKYEAYPKSVGNKLLLVRQLIFDVAAETCGVGPLEETLKWGQPSYLTSLTKSGSTIRIDSIKSPVGAYAVFFHCQTSLVDTFKEIYRDTFRYEGNRAIVFMPGDKLPIGELSRCIQMALTYHLNKRKR